MKKGLISFPILILGLIVLGGYYVVTYSSVYPNKKTQETARNIPKYSDISSWQIINDKQPCLLNFGGCQTPPSKILFKSEDIWPNVYNAYRKNMGDFGWTSNTRIVTSIPTSAVFENKEKCTSELYEDTSIFTRKDDKTHHFYVFTVLCKN